MISDEKLYHRLSPGDRYIHLTRDAAFFALLRRHNIAAIDGLRILELGCGEGDFLRTLLRYGARRDRLNALDIDIARLRHACAIDSSVTMLAANVAALPYVSNTFDLVVAFTMLSSVVEVEFRHAATSEALRVLRPGGLLVVYDFQVNPWNRRVRPVTAEELRTLFASETIQIERVTLAPPLARAFGRWPVLCRALESIPLLRTHLLAVVTRGTLHEPRACPTL